MVLAVLAFLLVLVAFQLQHRDADIFWALKSGEWIVENLKVPSTDPFSFTFEGSEWVDFTWGFQVVAHLFYSRLGGWTGLFILQVLATGATFLFLYLNLKTVGGKRAWLVSTLLFLVFASSYSRLFIRPHLFAFLFISLYLLLLNLYDRKGNARYIFALVPLHVLWINMHSSAVLGVFLVGAWALGAVIDGFRERGFAFIKSPGPEAAKLVIISLAVPLASVINPYGLKLALFPFIHQGGENADALRHIGEWTRIPASELLFYFYPKPFNFFAFRLLVVGAVAALVMNFRGLKTRDVVIMAGALYMALSHVRWVGQFAYFAAPVIAANAASYLESRKKDPLWFSWASLGLAFFVAVLMVSSLLGPSYRDKFGLGIKKGAFPEGTVSFMRSEGIRGRLFNDYIFGGYLIFAYPETKVFIDGRTPTVYSPYFFWTSRLVSDEEGWKRLSDEHGITAALVKIETPLCSKLFENPGWRAVVFDDVSVLYLRDPGPYGDTISRRSLKDLNPCADSPRYTLPSDREKLTRMAGELEGVISALGDMEGRVSRPHRLLGLVRSELAGEENLRAAVAEFRKALSVDDDARTHYDLGVALGKLEMREEALVAFKEAVERDDGFKEGYLAMGLAHHDMKNHEAAQRWLEEYISLADDSADYIAYKTHGMSCFELSRYDCAARSLERAAFIAADEVELSEVYYYLGNVYFEKGDYALGAGYYNKAMDNEPRYAAVLRTLSRELKEKGSTERARNIDEILRMRAG